MTPTLFILGLLGGFFSGLLGIGGGIIMVPLLLYIPPLLSLLPLGMKTIAGITMVQSLAGSLSSLAIHHRSGFVNRSLVFYMGVSSSAGALIGSVWSFSISETTITGIFVALALLASGLLLLPVQTDDKDVEDLRDISFNKGKASIIGFVVGLLGGILGQGGAFLIIPLLIYLLGIPTRIVLGSSVAISFISALAGFLGKWSTNQIPFMLAITVASGAVLGALLGGYISKYVTVKFLRYILAALIAATGLRMGYSLMAGSITILLVLAVLCFYLLKKKSSFEKKYQLEQNGKY
ncbi:MAG: sulfite exporter TauE/SafE family protein [Clostridia bacterium]|nr:sulfite exporter TauE/SafE family protein [Clostridia bacterium]